jgi:hypothetical protein
MTWLAVVFWDNRDPQNMGWAWRLQNLDTGQEGSGKAASAAEGLEKLRACLKAWGVDADRVAVEVLDEGVWEKC